MTPEDLKELLELLKSAGPSDPCPICSSGAYCHCEDWLDAEVKVERLRAIVHHYDVEGHHIPTWEIARAIGEDS